MATVRATGGDYSSLNAALAASESSITCDDDFTDTTAATVGADCTITASGDGAHAGRYSSGNHYLLRVSGGSHSLTINGAYTVTIDGLVIEQASTTTSAEAIRCTPGTSDSVTIKNSILLCSTNTSQQDCIYTGFNQSVGTITLEGCYLYGAYRAGVNMQNSSTAVHSATLNVNSCFLWNNGRGAGSDLIGLRGGGIYVYHNSASRGSMTINVHNAACLGNTGGTYAQDFKDDNPATSPPTWNVSYSVDSDGSIATDTDGGTGNLASHNVTDDDTKSSDGDWVIVEDISTAIPSVDLRLVSNDYNEAQDAHGTATAHSLTIPSADVVGTSRPQNTNYDVGPFEIAAGGDSGQPTLRRWRDVPHMGGVRRFGAGAGF